MCDPSDPISWRTWSLDDEVNILGTPLGSPDFETEYLSGKGLKHRLLLGFIKEVAYVGLHREAIDMVKGATIPRLSHILKSIQKNANSTG
jgi:hypothetical protein